MIVIVLIVALSLVSVIGLAVTFHCIELGAQLELERSGAAEDRANLLAAAKEERDDWRAHVERLERLVEAKSLSEAAAAERAYTGAPSPQAGPPRKRELTATEEMLGLGDNRRKEKTNGESVP